MGLNVGKKTQVLDLAKFYPFDEELWVLSKPLVCFNVEEFLAEVFSLIKIEGDEEMGQVLDVKRIAREMGFWVVFQFLTMQHNRLLIFETHNTNDFRIQINGFPLNMPQSYPTQLV